jgi:parvulin-like peptidyl-prolyl isomerase
MLLNIGFGITIVVAVLLLLVAFLASWYDQHLAPAATVNGQAITKDEFNRQLAINTFRNDYAQRRIRTLLTAGQIRSADAQARLSILDQRQQQGASIALEQLIDGRIMDQLASEKGITVGDGEVDERLTEEATTPELRHAWVIAVEPTVPEGASAPDGPAKAEARAAAGKALADLRAGKAWEEVAKAVSTDETRDQGGDLGFIDSEAALDPAFVDALMAASLDTPTDIVEDADGIYRIGRVTEITPPVVDATLASQVEAEGISVADFRAALRRDVVRTRLDEAIVAQTLAPSAQREVSEIFMQEGSSESFEGAVKTRHILYSPKGDPQGAAEVPATDPAWAEAEAKARATWDKVKADPSLFDAIARAESDEGAAETSGGKLPYFAPDDQIDEAFAAAIFKDGLREGQLLDPVKSAFGWHVIQVMHFPTDLEWAQQLTADIEAGRLTFADTARDNSDKAEAAEGGKLGWIARGQLTEEQENAIFAAPIGEVSEPLVIEGEGLYLYLVAREETREPDAAQREILETSAFPIWYSRQKERFEITREAAVTAGATS